MYMPEKLAEAVIAYLKTLGRNYRAQTTELGRENRSCKHTRDQSHQQHKRVCFNISFDQDLSLTLYN